MENNEWHYYPKWRSGVIGLSDGVRAFLHKNYPELAWKEKRTSKGSIGFKAPYRGETHLSVFVYQGIHGVMMDLYWNEREPSARFACVSLPVGSASDWEKAFEYLGEALPILSDASLDHTIIPNEELEEELGNALIQLEIFGGLVKVEGYRGADDDEVDGAMELVEKPMDQVELQHAIDAALDNGDHAEFLRLSALKESRTILLFEGFCKKLRGNRDI